MFPVFCTVQYSTHLRMGYRKCVHPHTPPSPLILDGMVEQNTKDVVHHLSDLLLFRVFRVDIAKRKHPVLPYGALKQTPANRTPPHHQQIKSAPCKPGDK